MAFTDNFTGPAGQKLTDRTGWTKFGSGWDGDGPEINASNQVRTSTGTDAGLIGQDTGTPDCFAQATVYAGFAWTGSGQRRFLCARAHDRNDMWGAAYNSGEGVYEVWTCEGGSYSRAGTWASSAPSGDVLRLEASGSAMTLSVNGTPRITLPSITYGSTFVKVGVLLPAGVGGVLDPVLDDFSSGPLVAGADTTPPTLSAATVTATGQTTITGGVTTTEAGPAWAVLTASTTKPSAAQIKAGQNASGVASPAATATLVVGANPGVFAFTGLTASTGYYLHVTQDDTATTPNTAAPVTSALVTTNAAPGVITLPALRNNTGTLLAYETGATVHAYAVATGNKVVTKTAQTSDASGVMAVTDAALVAGTEYRCVIVLASGAEGLQKATAA